MGTCACRGEREETDLQPKAKGPSADYVFVQELPPAYTFLSPIPPPHPKFLPPTPSLHPNFPPPIPPRPPKRNSPTFVAKYDYNSPFVGELNFSKGELLCVISTEGVWWYAQHYGTGMKGYVPSNYITQWKSLEDEEWYFGNMKRAEANELLMLNVNGHGSYLVRESESCEGDYALSVRNRSRVQHYLIRRLCTGSFYVSRRVAFENIQELVEYYQQHSDGLSVHLKLPCLPDESPTRLPMKEE